MKKVTGVRFKKVGKIYFFDPGELKLEKDMNVIVDTAMGEEYGQVVIAEKEIDDSEVTDSLKKVIRIATEKDEKTRLEFKAKEADALKTCEEKVAKHNLPMKLIDVEYKYDGSKLIFYFTADGRIDFRELVKDLAAVFRTRIELRQISTRDEVKRLGGCGACGRELCCCSFLKNNDGATIKMAKEQNLSLNSSKITGVCGRLMCCLKYEENVYTEKLKKLPHVGAIVETNEGEGVVESIETLKEIIKVKLKDDEGENYYRRFPASDIKVIKDTKRANKTGYGEEEDLAELEKIEELDKRDKKNASEDDE